MFRNLFLGLAIVCYIVACSTDKEKHSVQNTENVPVAVQTPPEMIASECIPAYVSPVLTENISHEIVDAAYDAGPVLGPKVFVYGNSLVYGAFATPVGEQLRNMLGSAWDTTWIGRGGWGTSMLITAAPHDMAKLNAENRSKKVFFFWEGVNEMGSEFNCEAYEIMAKKRLSEGWTVFLVTATPVPSTAEMSEDGGRPAASLDVWRQRRRTFNSCVKTNAKNWGVAGIVDIDSHPELLNPFNTAYFLDKVHLTTAGYSIVAADMAKLVSELK